MMPGRTFAQINCSLLNSRKLKSCNHAEKWVYLCAHISPLGNFVGLFRYPLVMWAQDAGLSAEDTQSAVAKLRHEGLLDYDFEEEMVRIVGFIRQRPPENASRMISMLRDLSGGVFEMGGTDEMLVATISECVVACIQRAQGWKPDSTEWPKLREELRTFLRMMGQEHGQVFLTHLAKELETVGKASVQELHSLFPPLSELPKPAPCGHRADTMGAHVDETETRLRREGDGKKEETETSDFARFEADAGVPSAERSGLLRKGVVTQLKGPHPETLASALAKGVA